jgi:hypothetical protein
MNDNEYILNEIARAEEGHDKTYFISLKFSGSKHSSKNINLTQEQFNKIKEVFK